MFAAALVAQDYIGGQVGIEAEDSRQLPVLVPQTGDFKVALCLSLGWYCPFVDVEPLLEIPGVDIEVFFGLGSGAKAVEHALTGIAQQAEVARVFVKAEGQCGVEARFEIQDFAGDDVDGGIPRDALPVAAATFVLDHGIEKPVFMVDLSLGCNHCASPECIRVCPENCYDKLRNGIVVHHSEHCIGCGRCVGACPYGAPHLNAKTGKVEKCDFCRDRLKEGKQPMCVELCPVGALKLIPLDDAEPSGFLGDPLVRYTRPSMRFYRGT